MFMSTETGWSGPEHYNCLPDRNGVCVHVGDRIVSDNGRQGRVVSIQRSKNDWLLNRIGHFRCIPDGQTKEVAVGRHLCQRES